MAEAVISDIAVGLISKLNSLKRNESGFFWGLTDELDKLKTTVSTIEAVLLHAEEQSMENLQIKHWLGLLSESMYDADDLLDELSTEVMGGSKIPKKVRLFFFALKMVRKVKAIRGRLDEIAATRKFHLEERVLVAKGRDRVLDRSRAHSSPPQVVVGRQVINNLVDLRLERCSNCVELPCLGDLSHLKSLKMNHLGKVKCVSSKFYGIYREGSSIGYARLFPALISLSISHMENLTEWCSPSDGNKVVLFPCLESLSIQSCPKLTGFPMSNLSELIKLEIRDCQELWILTSRQQSFGRLTSLSMVGCSKFTYLRNWLLSNTCLKLCVRRCEWLTFVPDDLGKVICLTSLEIYCCKRLRCFPEQILGKLTQLKNLSIGAFSEELDDFRYLNKIQYLPCLVELEIWGSDFFGREMSSLPNQLQHLTVLKSLKIMGFTTMEALPEWLTNIQSLESLSLDYCRRLECPSITTLTRNLPSLLHLKINCCPILEESKSECLQSLDTTRIKVEFSHVSNVRVRLGC